MGSFGKKAREKYFVLIAPHSKAPLYVKNSGLLSFTLKVSFSPKSRTAWHTHPLGQTLFVLSGVGLVGVRNETPKLINKGDSVWIPPNEEHWHGASNDTEMEHIAIQEALDGNVATWLEHVSDDQYYFK